MNPTCKVSERASGQPFRVPQVEELRKSGSPRSKNYEAILPPPGSVYRSEGKPLQFLSGALRPLYTRHNNFLLLGPPSSPNFASRSQQISPVKPTGRGFRS